MKRIVCITVLALLLAGCSAGGTEDNPAAKTQDKAESIVGAVRLAATDDPQCRILTDVGKVLAADNYDPQVLKEGGGRIDCAASFQSAGLPMLGDQTRGVRFHAPQFSGDDAAVVPVDFYCPGRCGGG